MQWSRVFSKQRNIHHLAHYPPWAVAGHHHRPQARIVEGHGGSGRAVQEVQPTSRTSLFRQSINEIKYLVLDLSEKENTITKIEPAKAITNYYEDEGKKFRLIVNGEGEIMEVEMLDKSPI